MPQKKPMPLRFFFTMDLPSALLRHALSPPVTYLNFNIKLLNYYACISLKIHRSMYLNLHTDQLLSKLYIFHYNVTMLSIVPSSTDFVLIA